MRIHTSITLELEVAKYLEQRKKDEVDFKKAPYINKLIKKDMVNHDG